MSVGVSVGVSQSRGHWRVNGTVSPIGCLRTQEGIATIRATKEYISSKMTTRNY